MLLLFSADLWLIAWCSIILACARDSLLLNHPRLPKGWTVAEDGFPPQTLDPSGDPIPPIRVFCRKAHGSINKAAAVTGIGRRNVVDVPPGTDAMKIGMDAHVLERELRETKGMGIGCIVVVGLGEVNTVSLAAIDRVIAPKG
jgi:hypothetical protein